MVIVSLRDGVSSSAEQFQADNIHENMLAAIESNLFYRLLF
jgi:hypothetical protein